MSTISNGTISNSLWIFNQQDSLFQSSPSYQVTNSGSQGITLISTSAFGCADTFTDSVFIKETPSASFSVENTCIDDTVNFISDLSAGSGYSIIWQFGDSSVSSLENPSHFYDTLGTYYASLTVTALNGCNSQTTSPVIISNVPDVNFEILNEKCQNTPISFNAVTTVPDSIVSVFWQFDTISYFGQSVLAQLDTFGQIDFNVKLIVGSNCSVLNSFSFYLNKRPSSMFTISDSCQNTIGAIYNSSSIPSNQNITSLTWKIDNITFNDSNSLNLSFLNGIAHFAELTILTDSNCTDTYSRTFEVVTAPTIFAQFTPPYCTDLMINYNLTTSIAVGDTIDNANWVVTTENGDPINYNQSNPSILLDKPINYNLTCNLITKKGCTASYLDSLIPFASPVLEDFSDTVCSNNLILVKSNIIGSNYNYKWTYNEALISTKNEVELFFQETGVKNINLYIFDKATGCSDEENFTIYASKRPEIELKNKTICHDIINEFTSEVVTDSLDELESINWYRNSQLISNNSTFYLTSENDEIVSTELKTKNGCQLNSSFILQKDDAPKVSFQLNPNLGKLPFNAEVITQNTDSINDYLIVLSSDTLWNSPVNLTIEKSGLNAVSLIYTNKNQCIYQVANSVYGYINTPDLAIISITVDSIGRETLGTITFRNNRDVPIANFDYDLIFSDGSIIRNTIEADLSSGEIVEIKLPILHNTTSICAEIINVNGLSDFDQTNNYHCSNKLEAIYLFPNPVYNLLNIRLQPELEQINEIFIYDSKSGLVFHRTVDPAYTSSRIFLPVTFLNAGIYYIVVNSKNKSFTGKFTKP